MLMSECRGLIYGKPKWWRLMSIIWSGALGFLEQIENKGNKLGVAK